MLLRNMFNHKDVLEICLLVLFSTISSGYAYYRDRETCANASISHLPDVSFDNLVGKRGSEYIWYSHLIVDDTHFIDKDVKVLFQREKGGRTLRQFIVGLSNNADLDCTIIEFRDKQIIPNRPCVSSKQVVPATAKVSEGEYIYAFLDKKKTLLLFYECITFDKERQTCLTVEAIATTTRPQLLPEEEYIFLEALRQFGTDLGASVVEDQLPISNSCEDAILRLLRRRKFQRKLKKDGKRRKKPRKYGKRTRMNRKKSKQNRLRTRKNRKRKRTYRKKPQNNRKISKKNRLRARQNRKRKNRKIPRNNRQRSRMNRKGIRNNRYRQQKNRQRTWKTYIDQCRTDHDN